jgi:hypothetical protein
MPIVTTVCCMLPLWYGSPRNDFGLNCAAKECGRFTQSDSESLPLMDIGPPIYLDPRISPSYLILAKSNLLPAISFLISSLLSILTSYSIRYRFLPKYSTGDQFHLRRSSFSRSISVDMVLLLRYLMLFLIL